MGTMGKYILLFLIVTVFVIFQIKRYRTYVQNASIKLNEFSDNSDYESIMKLRKEYRKKCYYITILISIYLLIIIIPLAIIFRKAIDSKFSISVAISTGFLILNGYVLSSKKNLKRFKLDGTNPNNLKDDNFVLYLRAFNDDDIPWSSEDEIVKAFSGKVPVYKIGKPNDIELGESDIIKFYETDKTWKEQISIAKSKAKYIILSLNGTDGLIWEYLDTVKYKEKIMYVVEKKESFTRFCIKYKQHTSHPLRDLIGLQQSYPCYFWYKNGEIVLYAKSEKMPIRKIVKEFIRSTKK